MAQITTVINVCDRCGSQHDKAKYMSGSIWGQLNVAWHGDKGGRAYDGSAGGMNLKGKAWLCRVCTDEFLAFMRKPNEHSRH